MPLKLKNDAALTPKSTETVEAVGITIPVHAHLLTAEKLTFAQMAEEMNSPVFILRAFSIFTRWRCGSEDQVDFDTLANADLAGDEIAAISNAVARLFTAARENEAEAREGKLKAGRKS